MSENQKSELTQAKDQGSLQALISRSVSSTRGPAPVESWHPEYCGELDMEIKRDGTWFYMGTPIGRAPLVRLFSTVLRKDEDGCTYLVTPVEMVKIRVEDAPFLAVEMAVTLDNQTQVLTFRTNVGDMVELGKEHPMRFCDEESTDGLKPYIHVRGRLEALVSRAVMYDLVALGEAQDVDGQEMFGVRSKGVFFPIMAMDRLEKLSR